jgi:hypothetical protein
MDTKHHVSILGYMDHSYENLLYLFDTCERNVAEKIENFYSSQSSLYG